MRPINAVKIDVPPERLADAERMAKEMIHPVRGDTRIDRAFLDGDKLYVIASEGVQLGELEVSVYAYLDRYKL